MKCRSSVDARYSFHNTSSGTHYPSYFQHFQLIKFPSSPIFQLHKYPAFKSRSFYNLSSRSFQMKPNTCTLLLSIFISTSVHFSGNYMPINRITYCIWATLVFFTLYGWLSGVQTRQPPRQSEKYQSRIDTVNSPDDGHIVARNMYRRWNKYTKNSVHVFGFIWKRLYRDARSREHKILYG